MFKTSHSVHVSQCLKIWISFCQIGEGSNNGKSVVTSFFSCAHSGSITKAPLSYSFPSSLSNSRNRRQWLHRRALFKQLCPTPCNPLFSAGALLSRTCRHFSLEATRACSGNALLFHGANMIDRVVKCRSKGDAADGDELFFGARGTNSRRRFLWRMGHLWGVRGVCWERILSVLGLAVFKLIPSLKSLCLFYKLTPSLASTPLGVHHCLLPIEIRGTLARSLRYWNLGIQNYFWGYQLQI